MANWKGFAKIKCYLDIPFDDNFQHQQLVEYFVPISKELDIFHCPYICVLVNQFGKIIQQSNDVHKILWYVTVQINIKRPEQIKQIQEQKKKQIQKPPQNFYNELMLTFHKWFDNKEQPIKFSLVEIQNPDENAVIKLKYTIMESLAAFFEGFLKRLFIILPKEYWIIYPNIIKKNIIRIPYPGQECAVCKINILNQPQQYYCPFKQEHVCMECAEFDDKNQIGLQRFKYEDTLIFINGPLSDDCVLEIDEFRIGEKVNQNHSINCDGCPKGVEGPRYISLNSNMIDAGRRQSQFFIDYCQECFQIIKDKKSSQAQEIIAEAADQYMLLDSLFLRVLFNHDQNYWIY